ncbi:MAG: TatD family hydrolase, partial [Clostridia bacterium]|nr:TatD family hydrolase [Clostridia bacterium]
MFDSHAHYDDKRFDPDRDEVLKTLAEPTAEDPVGVRFVLSCGDSMASSRKNIELSERYPFLFATGGVHPHEAKDFRDSDL